MHIKLGKRKKWNDIVNETWYGSATKILLGSIVAVTILTVDELN
jgi:hypothetical protein